MNIICIKRCNNIHNQSYKLDGLYRYGESDYIDGLDKKYYTIYDGENGNIFGYQTIEFINDNFVSVFEYNSELRYVTQIFEFFIDTSVKVV